MHRLASRGPCDPVASTLSDSRMTRLRAGWQGVPVVLPVREGPPGGSYGTADERHLPCPAVVPAGVPCAVTGTRGLGPVPEGGLWDTLPLCSKATQWIIDLKSLG